MCVFHFLSLFFQEISKDKSDHQGHWMLMLPQSVRPQDLQGPRRQWQRLPFLCHRPEGVFVRQTLCSLQRRRGQLSWPQKSSHFHHRLSLIPRGLPVLHHSLSLSLPWLLLTPSSPGPCAAVREGRPEMVVLMDQRPDAWAQSVP